MGNGRIHSEKLAKIAYIHNLSFSQGYENRTEPDRPVEPVGPRTARIFKALTTTVRPRRLPPRRVVAVLCRRQSRLRRRVGVQPPPFSLCHSLGFSRSTTALPPSLCHSLQSIDACQFSSSFNALLTVFLCVNKLDLC
ncbi:hypothetical protein PIB30_055165 [Stylosanthes scabra]|uniref:Uncharacterized protein n=1 Tax=Stylosanthes scabra TaxID=79078 RepID=A0ABU6ULB7_9FABA|nr:hypothetical protein [Stylosanthes scabra]